MKKEYAKELTQIIKAIQAFNKLPTHLRDKDFLVDVGQRLRQLANQGPEIEKLLNKIMSSNYHHIGEEKH